VLTVSKRYSEEKGAMPIRVQLKRSKGWRMPPDTLKVDRTTLWGNPFTPQDCGSAAAAIRCYEAWLEGRPQAGCPVVAPAPPTRQAIRESLAGHNLACWCAIGSPCHADTLLRIAND
jgi:hypothetical protein